MFTDWNKLTCMNVKEMRYLDALSSAYSLIFDVSHHLSLMCFILIPLTTASVGRWFDYAVARAARCTATNNSIAPVVVTLSGADCLDQLYLYLEWTLIVLRDKCDFCVMCRIIRKQHLGGSIYTEPNSRTDKLCRFRINPVKVLKLLIMLIYMLGCTHLWECARERHPWETTIGRWATYCFL